MEIARRLLLLLGILGAALAWIYCRPVLMSVEYVDFATAKVEVEQRPTGFLYRDDTLEEFYETRTSGRRVRVEDEAWVALYERLRTSATADAPDEGLASRRDTGYARDRYYFLPDEPPVREFSGGMSKARPLLYVQFGGEGPAAPTLTLIRHEGGDVAGAAPNALLRPHRPYAGALLALGLGAYLLLPRPRRMPDMIGCSRMSAVVLPDLLGALLTSFFFALPLLVIQQNAWAFSFDGGAWFVPLAACWLLALPGLVILGIAAFNASFSIQLADEALRIRSWRGSRRIDYNDIERVEAIVWRTPAWLRTFAWLLVTFAQRGVISALLLEQGRGQGLLLRLRGGGKQRLWVSGIEGWPRVVERLAAHGAPIDPAVHDMLSDT